MRRRRGLVTLAGAAMVVIGSAAGSAHAATSVVSGWWTSAPAPLAPDVGDDALLVQGDSEGSEPLAYAGISFVLAAGEVPQRLVLRVAPTSATTPGATLALCPLAAPAQAATGEPVEDGPSFDCSTTVESVPSADGTTYEFAVTDFAAPATLDIAVLPTQPTDRVVLQRPSVSSLQSRFQLPTDDTSSDTGFLGGSSSPSGGPSSFDDGFSSDSGTGAGFASTDPTFDPPGSSGLEEGGDDSARAITDEATSTPPSGQLAAAQPDVAGGGNSPIAPIAFIGLVLAAAVLWTMAGQESPDATDPRGEQP